MVGRLAVVLMLRMCCWHQDGLLTTELNIMNKYDFCPNCSIGLNSREMELGFCQNCKHDWTDKDEFDDEDDFQCCDKCDLPDACADFGNRKLF